MSSSQFPPPLSYSSGQGAIGPSSIHSPPAVLSPDSTNSIYASPDSGHQPFYLAKSEPDDGASTGSSAAAGPLLPEPLKKKQKRNKPTLSCHECVERKTKLAKAFVLRKVYERARVGLGWWDVSFVIQWYWLDGIACFVTCSFGLIPDGPDWPN
ncbi:hypothetical protein F4824DRAFT_503600 [Ustulina deusta]|nr:hypothetical protein F4824DRAFT_503600 [Ustulina deusta]